MALVKFGQGVADMRGAIGGTVFSRNRYGAYARNRTMPVDPATDDQVFHRGVLGSAIDAWQNTLTQAQRNGWNTLAANTTWQNKLGEDFHPSGVNVFVRSADLRILAAQPIVEDAPVSADFVSGALTFEYNGVTGAIDCTYISPPPPPDNGDLLIRRASPQTQSINAYFGPWTLVSVRPFEDFAALPVAVIGQGFLAENSRQWIYLRGILDNGMVSWSGKYVVDVTTFPP